MGSRGDNTHCYQLPERYFHRKPPIGNKKSRRGGPGRLALGLWWAYFSVKSVITSEPEYLESANFVCNIRPY